MLSYRLLLSPVESRLNAGSELSHRKRAAVIRIRSSAIQALPEVIGQSAALGGIPCDFVISRRGENHNIVVGGVKVRAAGLREAPVVHRERALRARCLGTELCAHWSSGPEIARACR